MPGPPTKTPDSTDLLFEGGADEDADVFDAASAAEGDEEFDFDVEDDGSPAVDEDADDAGGIDIPEPEGPAQSAQGPPPAQALPGDGIDLRPDQREAIDMAFADIEGKSFYEVLLLPRSADERAIKKAYYRLSKEYHPDKYYRKQLGPFKNKLEAIFNRVTEAYRVLSDAKARADYDALTFGAQGPKDITSQGLSNATVDVTFVPDSMRQKMPQRKPGTGPPTTAAAPKKVAPVFMQKLQQDLAGRVLKAREYAKVGQDAYEKGRFAEAATQFQLALAMDPRNTKLKALLVRSQSQSRNAKAEVFWKQAQEAVAAQNQKAAAELMQKAIDCKPTRGRYFNEFGKFVMQNTLQQKSAVEHLKHAVDLEGNNVTFLTDLGLAYDELGMPSNALRIFEKVLTIEPKNSTASKMVKKLK